MFLYSTGSGHIRTWACCWAGARAWGWRGGWKGAPDPPPAPAGRTDPTGSGWRSGSDAPAAPRSPANEKIFYFVSAGQLSFFVHKAGKKQPLNRQVQPERLERGGPLLKLRWMGTQRVQIERILPWFIRYACRAGTRDFCSALVALVVPVQSIFSSPYAISIHLSPSPSKLGRQPCWVACLLVCVSGYNCWIKKNTWICRYNCWIKNTHEYTGKKVEFKKNMNIQVQTLD